MAATDDRRRIDVLLEQVDDTHLRAKLAEEIADLTADRKFGLVFERHLPEAIRLPGATVRYGSTVEQRDGDGHLWTVKRVRDGKAVLAREGETQEGVPVGDLIVARKLGDPVFPGLAPVGSVTRGGAKPHHLVIEGENFHALQTLQYTHRGRIDLIYIDPPYNTGAGDWIYNDKYVGDKDAYRHSKWLSFMQRRLELAKELLAPTGVIIVAIGDQEHHRLRMLLDQVFGEKNFISDVVWHGGRQNDARYVSVSSDYMLIYARDESAMSAADVRWREPKPGLQEAIAAGRKAWVDSDGDASAATTAYRRWLRAQPKAALSEGVRRFDRIEAGSGRVYNDDKDLSAPEERPNRSRRPLVHPLTGQLTKVPSRGWAISDEEMDRRIAAGLIEFGADENKVPRQKAYLDESSTQAAGAVFERDRNQATKHLSAVLGGKDFPFPKDVDVIARWVGIASAGKHDAVVLDFFAGTGTTAEAVMRLNAADGGSRQSIVVTNNELGVKTAAKLRKAGYGPGDPEWEGEGVFEKVTRPRIETVVTGRRRDGSVFSDGFDENVTFTKLTYLDRDDVELGAAYRQVAHLLWVKAGGRGSVIEDLTGDYAIGDRYAVCFNVNAWARFADDVAAHPDVDVAFIVAGSATSYGQAKRALPDGVESYHLYENYLTNFEINTGESL